MGERIKDVGKISVGEANFDIEINKAVKENGPRYVHVQNSMFRYCLTEQDFIQFVADIKKARKNFEWRKGIKDE